jgi:acyl-CoA synthetase (AMP-forming)/AMP-acid ligase II
VIGKAVARVQFGLRRDHSLGTLFERLAAAYGDRRLVEHGETGRRTSFREAAALVDRWAGALHARIGASDRVVVATRNTYDQLLVCAAVARAGGIAVPVNERMRAEEIDHVVADAAAALVVGSPDDLDGHEPLGWAVPAGPGDVAALFYTSGTTGSPKGVALSHRALIGELSRTALLPLVGRRDEAIMGLPLAHIMGFSAALGFAAAGIPVVAFERFDAEAVLDAIAGRRASVFIGVPAMYRLMLDAGAAGRDLTSVRLWLSGADVLPPDVARQFQTFGATVSLPLLGAVGDAVVAEGYGMAELAGAVAGKVRLPLPFVNRLLPGDALGVPLPGFTLRVVGDDGCDVRPGQVGELWVKGPGVAAGYWGDASATSRLLTDDGWARTGDLAVRGPLGSVRFAGRSKDVVKHGGFSVYAVEVEEVLQRQPVVAEAAVVGVADPRFGEQVAAAVRLVPGATAEPDELMAACRQHLAHYKCPTWLLIVDDLPRNGTGKVDKGEVRALFT